MGRAVIGGIEVIVLACQVARQCEIVNPGLSPAVEAAVKPAAELLASEQFH